MHQDENGKMNHCGHTKILRKVEIEQSKIYPEHAVKPVFELIVVNQVHLKIVRADSPWRLSKGLNGKHEITVNSNLNKYKFLITLIHEISHLVAFEKIWKKY
jgi:hypothetical protein